MPPPYVAESVDAAHSGLARAGPHCGPDVPPPHRAETVPADRWNYDLLARALRSHDDRRPFIEAVEGSIASSPIEIDWTALADNIIRSSLLASNEESYLFRHGLTIESDIQALIYFFNNTAASAEVRSPWARSSRGAPG